MKPSNVNRLQWVHRNALRNVDVDPDQYYYKLADEEMKDISYTEEELLETMQAALISENNDIIGRPPFHLRNGDLIVWTDITWKPNDDQIEELKKLDKVERKKKLGLRRNPN